MRQALPARLTANFAGVVAVMMMMMIIIEGVRGGLAHFAVEI